MAKIGIIFLGLLTVHLAFGAPRSLNRVEIDDYISQIRDTSYRLAVALQREVPNSKSVTSAFTWNILKTRQVFSGIIKQLQNEKNKYNAEIDRSIDALLGEFLGVMATMEQTEVYVNTKDENSLKKIVDVEIQTMAEEIVKLARYINTHYQEGSMGSLHVTIRSILADFLASLQDMCTMIEALGRSNLDESTNEEMKVEIQKLTIGLVNYFDGKEYEDTRALKVFIRNFEFIFEELNEVTIEDRDVHSVLQQFAKKLQELMQISGNNLMESKAIVNCIQDIYVIVDQLLFDVETRFLETSSQRFIQNLIQNYMQSLKYFVDYLRLDFNDENRPLVQSSNDHLSSKYYNKRIQQIFPDDTLNLNIYLATVADNLDVTLRSINLNNEIAQQIFFDQLKEYDQQLSILISKIGRLIYNHDYDRNVLREVFENLQNIVRNSGNIRNISDVSRYFKNAIGEIEKLTSLEKGNKSELTEIVYDFISILRTQQIHLENINKTNFLEFDVQQLTISIHTTTNTLMDLLNRTPANNEILVRKIRVRIGYFIKTMEIIVNKLNVLVKSPDITLKLQRSLISLKTLNTNETYSTISELTSQLNYFLQHIASQMEELSLLPQQEAIKQMLIEYWYNIQNTVLQVQRMIETGQTGRTPKELALHIQIATQKISDFLVHDKDVDIFIRQARHFLQALEITTDKLKFTTYNNKILIKIKSSFQQTLNDVHVFDRLRTEFEYSLKNVATEMETLALASQADFQESYGKLTSFTRGILIDYLYTLEYIEKQMQNNLASKLSGYNFSIMGKEIQSIANELYDIFPQIQNHHKQTTIVQIGQLLQTIENIIQLMDLNQKCKENFLLEAIVKNFKQISEELQEILMPESMVKATELRVHLKFGVLNVIDQVQKMSWIARSSPNEIYKEVVKTVSNNLLSTLRNMYNQINAAIKFGENPTQIFGEIETFTNILVSNLNTKTSGTETAKQALTIHIFKYAAQIQKLIVKIDSDPSTRDILRNLRQTVAYLQQFGEAWASLTTTDLKKVLSNQIQNVAGQMQPPIAEAIILDYLAVLQNLNVQIRDTFGNHNLADQIENAVTDLTRTLQKIPLRENGMEDVLEMANEELLKFLANAIKNLWYDEQNEELSYVVDQLRDIQLRSKQTVNEQEAKMQFLLQIEQASITIKKLQWAVNSDVVRTTLNNFLTFVRHTHIRVRINVQNYEKRYGYEFHLRKYNEDLDREGYPKINIINKDVVGYGVENAFNIHNFKNVRIDKYIVGRRKEQPKDQEYFKYAEVNVDKDGINKNKMAYKYGSSVGEKGYGYDFGLKKYNPNFIDKSVRGFGYDRFYDQYEIKRNFKNILINKDGDERVRSI